MAPTADDLRTQIHRELPAVRRELSSVLDRYWDDEWRRSIKGFGVFPEDHLWRAASAVAELTDTLEELSV